MKFVPPKFQSFRVTCATSPLVASTSYIHKIFYLCDGIRARCDPKLLLFHSVHTEAYYIRAILSACIQSRTSTFLLFSQILYYIYIYMQSEREKERRGKGERGIRDSSLECTKSAIVRNDKISASNTDRLHTADLIWRIDNHI